MWSRANSLSVLRDRLSCWLKWKRKAVSFQCVQTTNKSVQGAVLMGSLHNDIKKQCSPLHLDTLPFSPVCHSYHSPVVIKLSCSSFHLYEYDSVVPGESGCENGTVKSGLPCCGSAKLDQICSRRWQNSKCCGDDGGEDILSAKSSLPFFQNEHHFPDAVISSYQWLLVIFLDIHPLRCCSLVVPPGEWTPLLDKPQEK